MARLDLIDKTSSLDNMVTNFDSLHIDQHLRIAINTLIQIKILESVSYLSNDSSDNVCDVKGLRRRLANQVL